MDLFRVMINGTEFWLPLIDQKSEEVHNLKSPFVYVGHQNSVSLEVHNLQYLDEKRGPLPAISFCLSRPSELCLIGGPWPSISWWKKLRIFLKTDIRTSRPLGWISAVGPFGENTEFVVQFYHPFGYIDVHSSAANWSLGQIFLTSIQISLIIF